MPSSSRAIIHITVYGKSDSRINYSRRMYAIIRRYTPDVEEGGVNECFADLTGLRTFLKMTYVEMAEKIKKELTAEIKVRFTVRVASTKTFAQAKSNSKKLKSISTYKEINKLFAGSAFVPVKSRQNLSIKRRRFTIPFIGKVN